MSDYLATTASARSPDLPDHPDHCLAYQRLLQQRRRLGDSLYGRRHLSRGDLAESRVQEAADTVVYLRLHRLALAGSHPPGTLERLERLIRDGERLGELCASILDCASASSGFAEMLAVRLAYGERNYGEAFRTRDNLTEALEEIADCDLLGVLERERHRHLTGLEHPAAPTLSLIADRCVSLAEGVLALQHHLRQAASAVPRQSSTECIPTGLVQRASAYLRGARERERRARQPSPALASVTPLPERKRTGQRRGARAA
jgi:hypothetical protein